MWKEIFIFFQWVSDTAIPSVSKLLYLLIILVVLTFLDSYFDFSRSIIANHKYSELQQIQNLLLDKTLDKKYVDLLTNKRDYLMYSKSTAQVIYNFFFGFNDKYLHSKEYPSGGFSWFWFIILILPPYILWYYIEKTLITRRSGIGPKYKSILIVRRVNVIMPIFTMTFVTFFAITQFSPALLSDIHFGVIMFYILPFLLIIRVAVKDISKDVKRRKAFKSSPELVRHRLINISNIRYYKKRLE